MTEIKLFLLLILAAPLVQAQRAGQALTWEDCVSLAARKNPDLAAASWDVEAGRASYQGSFNGLLPRVSLSNGYSDSSGFSGDNHWQASASASMDVVNAGRIADIKSASARLDQSKAGLRLASSNLRFNLRRSFTDLLFTQTSIDVSRTILERRRKNAQLVALRYDSGRESRGNMLRSKAQALQAQTDLAQSLRDLRTSQKALHRQLGSDKFSVVAVTGTLQAPPPEELPFDLQPLLAGRPDISAREASVKSVEIGVSQARSALWPSLSANYTRSLTGPTEFPNGRYSWSAGGQLNYPLFSGGPTAAYSAISAAQRNLYSARESLRSARDLAIVDLESSWVEYAAADDQVKVQSALLEAARQRNEEADIRYASGLLSYDNWEIIASDRISSERQNISARLNAVNAQAAWERALGKALGE